MPYAPSLAQQKAATRLRELRVSFIYAKIRTRQIPTHVRDSIFQNSVFQLSAALEDYLGDLVSGWFTKLQLGGATNSLIPLYTRSIAVTRGQEETIRKFISEKDESAFVDKLLAASDFHVLINGAGKVPNLDFFDLVIKDKKFPSVRNFRALFRRAGVSKMTQLISKRTGTDFELNLQSFMDVRNALAHASPPSITDEDVKRHFDHIKKWTNAIDREFYYHVRRVSGEAYWQV